MSCPICERRPAKRYCPPKGGRICAVCCGTEREVTIHCPADCEYLIAARRWERDHPRPVSPGDVPYPDIEFSADLIHEYRPVVSGLAYNTLQFARENASTVDADVLAGLAALAETYRTLGSGIYYEKPPEGGPSRGVYDALTAFLQQARQDEAQRAGFSRLKDTEIFYLLVFLLRVGRRNTNGRPLSRAYLDFLRAQFPASPELDREAPRIITP